MTQPYLVLFSLALAFTLSLDVPAGEPILRRGRGIFGTRLERKAIVEREVQKNIANQLEYKGLKVEVNADAVGNERLIQQQIANLLSKRNDFVPAIRTQRFRFISEKHNTVITGWHGYITGITRTPEGIVAEVRIMPRNDGNPSFHTSDFSVETYLFTNGKIQYLNSVFPQSPPVVVYN